MSETNPIAKLEALCDNSQSFRKKKLPIGAAVLIIAGMRFLFSSEYVKYAKLENTVLD